MARQVKGGNSKHVLECIEYVFVVGIKHAPPQNNAGLLGLLAQKGRDII